jgi:hypothetical protein
MAGSRTHGLPRPALGANGEVTAVSTHNEATRNPWRGSIPIVAGDNLRPGPSRLPLSGRPDGLALTAPSPHPAAHSRRDAQRARPHPHRARRSAKESAFDFVEDY